MVLRIKWTIFIYSCIFTVYVDVMEITKIYLLKVASIYTVYFNLV